MSNLNTVLIPLVRDEILSNTTCQEMRHTSTLNLVEEKKNLIKKVNDKEITQLLQDNPSADKWISSWILDPHDQDRKVLLWTLNFLFMKLNYPKKKMEEE
jgi:hypothetical protein